MLVFFFYFEVHISLQHHSSTFLLFYCSHCKNLETIHHNQLLLLKLKYFEEKVIKLRICVGCAKKQQKVFKSPTTCTSSEDC